MWRRHAWLAACAVLLIAASPTGATAPPAIEACYRNLPDPEIAFVRMALEPPYLSITIAFANVDSYPPELFAPAPQLPPCGLNTSGGRMWMDIYGPSGHLWGDCGGLPPLLYRDYTFGVQRSQCPATVYIVLFDRQCGLLYRSNTLPIPCSTTAVERTTWALVKTLYRN